MKKRLFCAVAALFALITCAYAADELLVTPTFGQTEARSMLDMINAFRTGDEAHYWNESNTAQVSSKGEPLAYSYALEEIAMQRAAEIALSFSHTRPDGTDCFSAVASNGTQSWGENIAAGSATASGAFTQWREDNDDYSGQGHRRNMLNRNFRAIGIGHVVLNGTHYWAQEFSYSTDSAPATAALDAADAVAITVASAQIRSVGDLTAAQSELALQVGESASLPTASASVTLSGAWPGRASTVNVIPVWTSGDASVCAVDGQQASGVSAGTAVLTGAALGKTVSVSVTVSGGSGGSGGDGGGNGQDNPPVADGVYAILYEDGTLVFQNGNASDGRAVKKMYEVDLTAGYRSSSENPWNDECNSIRVVNFAEKISPISTANWFHDCENLERVDNIQNLDTANVTDMSSMFERCLKLTALDASTFNTTKVTDMSYMFYACQSLTTLNVSNFDTANVTSMREMFYQCGEYGALTVLDLSSFDTAKVTNMSGMFWDCSKLQTIYVSGKFTTSFVTDGKMMLYNCSSIVGGNGTKYNYNYSNAEYARIDTASAPGYFTAKDAPAPVPANGVYAILYEDGTLVFQNGNASDGRAVKKTYPVDLTVLYTWDSGKATTPWYDECESILAVLFADKVSPVSTAYWFCYCFNLKRVDNIQNLDTSRVTDMLSMFSSCCELETLDVSRFNTANVTNMSHMFSDCYKLTALDMSNFDTANVTDMSGMFSACKGLLALDVSRFNTAKVTNMSHMFSGCSGLKSLDVSHLDTTHVADMSGMFSDCSGLTALDLSRFNTANVTDMKWMFSRCSGLEALDLSRFNTANVTNMAWMFQYCSSLTALDVSRFDTAKVTDMRWLFASCKELKTLDLSHFDTANVTNMSYMFASCSNLKTIYASEKFVTASIEYDEGMFDNYYASLVGGSGTKYDDEHIDAEYARIDNPPDAPGYFTAKDAPAPVVAYEITDAIVNDGTLYVRLSNPGAATVAVAYFDADGKFVSVALQSAEAGAGTAALALSADAKTAHVMALDDDFRPLCACFETPIG